MTRSASWIGLGVLLLLAALPLGCARHAAGARAADKPLVLNAKLKPELLAPFAKEQLPSIQGNVMHERHFADGVRCGSCHPTDKPMPLQEAHKVCQDCHADRQVAKPVWLNHCLACHHFTKISQEYDTDAGKMVEHLCSKCHVGDTFGGSIYMLSGHQTSEMVKCDHCHRPHDSAAPAAAELCVTCHPEFKEVKHPGGSEAKCSICHGAHRPPPSGSQLCTACHGQAPNVLVHKIPNHPKDCLKCHNAHFTTIEIKGVCGDCHEGIVYNGGANQPAAHLDCEHCHNLSTFKFKGNNACGNCHEKEGAMRFDDRTPSKHKNCTTCHAPHTWRASFSRNCTLCHDTSKVPEHSFDFHKDLACNKCHDPHRVADMPKSGECGKCHKDIPSFGAGAPEMHRQCSNCHAGAAQRDFTVASWADTCHVCHPQARSEPALEWSAVPSGHTDCSVCHQTHSMQLAGVDSSCAVCHSDVVSQAPNEMHKECFNCHAQNHSVAFVGVASSCAACHGMPPGTHSAAGHKDCLNCHSKHTFAGDTTICIVCHGDKQQGHHQEENKGCAECHTFKQ